MKVLVAFGTRPEAIKLAPVIHQLRRSPLVDAKVAVTGQHRELLDQVMQFFGIEPDYRLQVMRPNQDLTGLTARILDGLNPILDRQKPDIVLTQGDTATCFAASLAAFYTRIPVAHVEAGLRTHNLASPFPEEGMRQMVSRLATLHFAPTVRNSEALRREGIAPERICVTGNTVIDAVLWARRKLRNLRACPLTPSLDAALAERLLAAHRIVLVTSHRRENFGEGVKAVCESIGELADRHEDVTFTFPVHPNPNVARPVEAILGRRSNVLLLPALDYPSFVYLMDRSYFIVTDSGGVQEEAPSLGKPVLVTRTVTERQEAVASGHVRLVGTDRHTIISEAERLLTSSQAYARMAGGVNPYGDGRSSARIVSELEQFGSNSGWTLPPFFASAATVR